MADKIFYVTRTENEQTHTAGTASLHRADKPQLVKVYDNPTDIDVSTLSEGEVVGTKGADFNCVAIVDRVAADNMNPVTSNAVAKAISTAQSYSTDETPTGGYWIDGKPIYRKVYTGLSLGDTGEAWTNAGITVSNLSTTINVTVLRTMPTASDVIHDLNVRVLSTGVIQYYTKNRLDPAANILVLEYTKTEIPTRESETKKSGDDKSEEVKSDDEKPVESDDGNHGVYIVPKENTPNPYSGAYTSNGGEIIQGR